MLLSLRQSIKAYQIPEERLGTSSLNHVFIKIYPYDPTSKFQEEEIGSDLKFMQSKIKICKADMLYGRLL